MRIAVDVDDVVADLMSEWLRRYNNDWNDTLRVEDVHTWDLTKVVKPECGEQIYEYLQDTDLYEKVFPIPNAAVSVEKLRYAGHDIVFATSNVYGMSDQKLRWLFKYGFISKLSFDEVVVMVDKTMLRANVIIDDKPSLIARWAQQRLGEGILFEQPWNKYEFRYSMSRVHRVDNWPEIVNIVTERIRI